MGIFGSSRKTYVGTSVVRAIEDKNLPDSVRAGLYKGVMGQGGIVENALDEMLAGLGRKAERAYRYAQRAYPMGLPASQTFDIIIGNEEAQQVLDAIEGTPVNILYANVASPNLMHMGWMKLMQDYGYDPATNELKTLSAEKGYPVFLNDMVPTYPASEQDIIDLSQLEYWGKSPKAGPTPTRVGMTDVTIRFSAPYFMLLVTRECLSVTIEWDAKVGDKSDFKIDQFKIFPVEADDMADYIHVFYEVNGAQKYWAYKIGSGTYPLLDGLLDKPAQSFGEFFPYTYFRHDKKPISENKNSDEYKSAKKMGKILGMDYDHVSETIEENPDVKDVQQAVLMFAVPANTENLLEVRYLFDFFNKMFSTQDRQYQWGVTAPVVSQLLGRTQATKNSIVIKDKLFQMAIRHNGIFKRRVSGKIGDVGTYAFEYGRDSTTYKVDYGEGPQDAEHFFSTHTYRHQVSSSIYEEVTVHALATSFKVFEQYETIGDEEDAILIVPIDRAITKNYQFRDREVLFGRSMHYVFNSRVVVKLKWYQTGIFKLVMTVVAIIMVVWTGGQSLNALAAGLAAGGAAATLAIMTFLAEILVALAIQAALKIFVKLVGVDFAIFAAIVAAVAGGYQYVVGGGVKGSPWVQTLVDIATGLTKAISSVFSDLMGDLAADYSNFLKDAEEKMKGLETAQELLERNNWMSPFVIFGETPDEFYNRTVHSGNIGVVTIESVTRFVETALTLPKLSETIGDPIYGDQSFS